MTTSQSWRTVTNFEMGLAAPPLSRNSGLGRKRWTWPLVKRKCRDGLPMRSAPASRIGLPKAIVLTPRDEHLLPGS